MSEPDPLSHEPFSFRETKAGLVQIIFDGQIVTTLAGQKAGRFMTRVAAGDAAAAQQLMARATGNFKRGNERLAKEQSDSV